jgi:hypothetical protein
MLLGRSIEGERGVVLLGDVRRVLDPDALDDVSLDVEAQDVPGVESYLVDVVGELDPAGLAATTDLDLGLHDNRVAGGVSCRDGLVNSVGDPSRGDRDAEGRKELLPLILEKIHAGLQRMSHDCSWRRSERGY